jgi:hypothetical protein
MRDMLFADEIEEKEEMQHAWQGCHSRSATGDPARTGRLGVLPGGRKTLSILDKLNDQAPCARPRSGRTCLNVFAGQSIMVIMMGLVVKNLIFRFSESRTVRKWAMQH